MSNMIKHPRGCWLQPNSGEILSQNDFLQEMAKKQVVLLGERHDIAEIHRWQLHTANYLHAYRPNMMMGFEMFPARVQSVLDEWVSGTLSTEAFLEKVQWNTVWGFPPEIYLPLFHFCRQMGVRMLALNCYRELVTRVGKEGWDAIPENERDGLTPSAPPQEGHRAYLQSLTVGYFLDPGKQEIPDRFIRAQQTWDRAFACNIAKALNEVKNTSSEPPLIIGIMGKGHVEYGFGTPHQLNDLGIHDVGSLIPTEDKAHDREKIRHVGDALFRLDTVEAPAVREKKT